MKKHPASPSPSPAKGKRKRTTAGSGPSSPAPFARYDPDSSSWRTYPDSEGEGSTLYSATLPRSGMTRNGTAYQLPPLAHPTDGTGSGLWPTPNASVAQDGEGPATWLARREILKVTANNGNGAGMPLTIAVQLWPTPTHRDWKSGINHSCWDNARPLSETVGGLLNPPWVERLMGFKEGWTELPPGKEIPHAPRRTSHRTESQDSEH